jgi:4-amino-4-deoxy-L-arabinose transferase-like glycosyltransferase
MRANKITTEQSLYWLAFLLALALRLFQLGAVPLTDAEAGWALQARGLAQGGSAGLGAQPAYILLNSQLFSLFGDTNFMARLFPALAGSLLVWLPFLLRRWMGASSWLHRAGLVLAFGLAIDPGLVSLSRQVGSPMPALAFTLLALAALYNRQMIGLGIFAGLALLSGPAFLQGVLVLGISWGLIRLASRKNPQAQSDEGIDVQPVETISSSEISMALAAFLATLLVVGTLFLHTLQGMEAWLIPYLLT